MTDAIGDLWKHTEIAPVYASFCAALDDFGGFEHQPRLMVAVSGGADSLALCLLAHRWAGLRGGSIHAVTIDHGLRPEAGQEAQQVADWLASYGISHSIKHWQGAKPTSAVQAVARQARYALLDQEAESQGILHILLGHHEDDQRETVFMRELRGSRSGAGGAGMPAVSYRKGARILRPLLGLKKTQLERLCQAHDQRWVEDPSNQSDVYERVRVRQDLAVKTAAKLGQIDQAMAKDQQQRQKLEDGLTDAVARYVRLSPLGWAWIDRNLWGASVAPDIQKLCLVRVVMVVGGLDYPPSKFAMQQIESRLFRGSESMTVGGCILRMARGGVTVAREIRDQIKPFTQPAVQCARFDKRFVAFSGDEETNNVEVFYPETHADVRALHEWLEAHSRGENTPNRTIMRRIPVRKPVDEGCLAPALGYDWGNNSQKGTKIRFSPPHSMTYCLKWLAPLETDIIS